jgi:hypothetical protein
MDKSIFRSKRISVDIRNPILVHPNVNMEEAFMAKVGQSRCNAITRMNIEIELISDVGFNMMCLTSFQSFPRPYPRGN